MTGERGDVQRIGKVFLPVMQFPSAFFARFYSHLLITGLIQNPTIFPKALIDVDVKGSLN